MPVPTTLIMPSGKGFWQVEISVKVDIFCPKLNLKLSSEIERYTNYTVLFYKDVVSQTLVGYFLC